MTKHKTGSIIKFMGLTGKIIVNRFGVPGQSLRQAERLMSEFAARGVDTEIISDGYLGTGVFGEVSEASSFFCDFVVYLDKDKYLSAILEKKGIRLFNRHDKIRVCDDKGETVIALSGHGFNLPDTVFAPLCYNAGAPLFHEDARNIAERLGFPVVVKESFGSMGKGVHKADNMSELTALMQRLKTVPHIYQRYIDGRVGQDVRVIVIGGKAEAAMLRSNKNDFRSNIALGGKGEKIELKDAFFADFISEAERAARVLGMDYCGVDILFGKNGEPVICEVNSNAFFEGIEAATGVNVAAKYAEYILNTLK